MNYCTYLDYFYPNMKKQNKLLILNVDIPSKYRWLLNKTISMTINLISTQTAIQEAKSIIISLKHFKAL